MNVEEPTTVYEGLETTSEVSKPDYQEMAVIKTNDNLTSNEVMCFTTYPDSIHKIKILQAEWFINGCHKDGCTLILYFSMQINRLYTFIHLHIYLF